MFSQVKVVGVGLVLMTGLFCVQASDSYAWGRHREDCDRGHETVYVHERPYFHSHPYFGLHVSFLPRDAFSVTIGGSRYYYHQGYYYFRDRDDYVIATPPLGAVTTVLPVGYQPVVMNGVTYYVNNGVYYLYTPQGYQVVPQPVTYVQPNTVPVTQIVTPENTATVTTGIDDFLTVNIPNDKGGYTSVALKKSGSGYVGPQGEFYAEFPKVSQLKAMYVK